MPRYLVTGGAGYVGSHIVLALVGRGAEVVVLDDLSQGHRAAVPADVALIEASLSNRAQVAEAFAGAPFDAVLHFAARSLVGESMANPLPHIGANLGNALILAEEAIRAGCLRFVLSSTANLFGEPERIPIDEDCSIAPGSPYGESKLMIERALDWAHRIHGLRFAALRYFNAAGADPEGRLGEDHTPETHLIPLAIDAVLGLRPPLTVFGDDYPTPDGTCIRDYVHVTDLADAHLRVLDRLGEVPRLTYNIGSGSGHSVKAVLDSVARVAGRPVPHAVGPRRGGDPAVLVAASDRLRRDTGWAPRFGDLDAMVQTAFAWRQAHPRGYAG
ncbi:UDP-glucose 4-epimerase GalE [Plastoroseomonas hellenica]|uniref:UDP-glucose 4-epimerase GalE n=1 Tax=Plastoroseomonas hellenica TaxID=2687306 RepID=UPI001BA9EAF2|nr:UDP-glucose 4-epimerase GalE [Plastoroseomonas hellenica]MBR0645086.1 UDP-glucose 4-epimerase GalE [Plastoroseomonas hellenica]